VGQGAEPPVRKKIGLALGMGGIKVRSGLVSLNLVLKLISWCCAFFQNLKRVTQIKFP